MKYPKESPYEKTESEVKQWLDPNQLEMNKFRENPEFHLNILGELDRRFMNDPVIFEFFKNAKQDVGNVDILKLNIMFMKMDSEKPEPMPSAEIARLSNKTESWARVVKKNALEKVKRGCESVRVETAPDTKGGVVWLN